ncbi:velvet factor-domain-containing protein, partial [Mycena rosella]
MRRQYELTVRQEPKQARMCGIGGKADRRPIDPPVIVQLRVIDPAQPEPTSSSSEHSDDKHPDRDRDRDRDSRDREHERESEPPYANLPGYAQSFLQNPYYFMFASLAKPDDDTELHWLKDGRTRCTTGSVVSSLYALKDPTAPGAAKDAKDGPTTAAPACDAGFFVFPDLSVRTEGSYRLKLSLFEVVGNDVRHCKSIYSAPFYVYTAKKFPGVEESSPLTCSLADQGIKIRIRKDIRMRKARAPGMGMGMGSQNSSHRPAKRSRTDDGTGSNNTGGAPPVGTAWPSTPLIPPPPGAEIQGPAGQVGIQGAQGPQMVIPPPPPAAGPSHAHDGGYDARAAYDANAHHVHPQQQQQQQQHPGQQQHQQHQQQQHPGQQQHIPPPPPPGYRADAMPPPPPPPHPGYAPPPPPPQYQHPYYPYPPWPGAYSDPYAHGHGHHHPYAPPPPMRYDYAYPPPPPHAHHAYPYYEQQQQPQYAEYGGAGAGAGYGGQPGPVGVGPGPGPVPSNAGPNVNAMPGAGMQGPGANMQQQQQQQQGNMPLPPNPNMQGPGNMQGG